MTWDYVRQGYNAENNPLYLNTDGAEGTSSVLDIVSNGFKIRSTDGDVNTSSAGYLFMAFAKSPFKYANAR